MILKKLACSLLLLAVAAPAAFGQLLPTAKKPTDDPAALRKDAVAFLRETMADVSNLRTLENRISFSAELAGLMWFHDEKEARSLYQLAFENFKELLLQYDMQMNAFGPPAEGEEEDVNSFRRGGIFGDVTEKSQLMRRFQTAMQVRQQIAMSLAEHDAELAFAFYNDSLSALSNPLFRKQMEARDSYFEGQLLAQIAQSNAAKAAQLGAKAIQDGINYQHIELLKKIHQKDPEKGAEFAASLLGKLKSEKDGSTDFWVISSLMNTVSESFEKSKGEGGKKPMMDQQGLRDLADAFAQRILNNEEEYANGLQYVDQIEKYAPSRGVQIRAKFRSPSQGSRAVNAANHAADVADIGTASTNSNAAAQREKVKREEAEKAESDFKNNVDKLGSKELSKEEREKIITQARRILLQSPGKDKKIVGLSALAAQVAKVGDKELAAEIMKEAQGLVNPLPKTYQDFLLSWMLATGYAESEPEKAFPLLEDTILRANDTITAMIKVAEFIDVAGEVIAEGEVQVGAFGGQMVRGLTSELGMADATLRTLARADFKKTRDLTSRFDRSEVRILAKMMILRAVLGGDKQKKAEEEPEAAAVK